MDKLTQTLLEKYDTYSDTLCKKIWNKLSIEQQTELLNIDMYIPRLIIKIWSELNIKQIFKLIKSEKIMRHEIENLYNYEYTDLLLDCIKEQLWLDVYINSKWPTYLNYVDTIYRSIFKSEEEYLIYIWPSLDIEKQMKILKYKKITINFLKKYIYSFKKYKDGTLQLKSIIKYQYITKEMIDYMWIYLNDDLKYLLCKKLVNQIE